MSNKTILGLEIAVLAAATWMQAQSGASAASAPQRSQPGVICEHAAPPRGSHWVCKPGSVCDCHLERSANALDDGESPNLVKNENGVMRVERARVAAMTNGNYDQLAKLLSDDLTYIHTTGEIQNKSEFLAALRRGELRYESMQPSDMRARVYGDTAVLTGRSIVHVVASGKNHELHILFTEVWRRRSGAWQMVAWQSTRVSGN